MEAVVINWTVFENLKYNNIKMVAISMKYGCSWTVNLSYQDLPGTSKLRIQVISSNLRQTTDFDVLTFY